jgi:hypothetical protein
MKDGKTGPIKRKFFIFIFLSIFFAIIQFSKQTIPTLKNIGGHLPPHPKLRLWLNVFPYKKPKLFLSCVFHAMAVL